MRCEPHNWQPASSAHAQVNPQLDGRIVACQLTPNATACASAATATAGIVRTAANPAGSIVPFTMHPMQEQVQCSR